MLDDDGCWGEFNSHRLMLIDSIIRVFLLLSLIFIFLIFIASISGAKHIIVKFFHIALFNQIVVAFVVGVPNTSKIVIQELLLVSTTDLSHLGQNVTRGDVSLILG